MNESERVRLAVSNSRSEPDPRTGLEAAWKDYVRRCAASDAGALAKLYDESSSVVFAIALRMVGNEADAEEVMLDTFTQLWRTAPGYDPGRGSVGAWLVTIARHRQTALAHGPHPSGGTDRGEPGAARHQRQSRGELDFEPAAAASASSSQTAPGRPAARAGAGVFFGPRPLRTGRAPGPAPWYCEDQNPAGHDQDAGAAWSLA